MFTRLIRLELKSFFRSPQFTAGLLMKIGMFFMYLYFSLIFIGSGMALYFATVDEKKNPMLIYSRIFLIIWAVDLLLKYFFQQLPANNIKPLLTQRITKNQITKYTIFKIMSSYFSWAFLLFVVPFTILILSDGSFSTLGVISLLVMSISLLTTNTFINTIINKKEVLAYIILGIIFLVGILHYFEILDILQFSEKIFFNFYTLPFLCLLPFLVTLVMGYFTFGFIKKNLYLDKGLEMKKTIGKTENIQYLNRFGTVGTFINNDIKLIKRSKAARSAFFGGIIFLLYGFLYYNSGYKSSFMQVFMGIFVTGGFNLMFGQRVPAWDSSYYPLMMTQNVPYKDYLKGKWAMFIIGIVISMILAIGYAFAISWEFYFTMFAAGLYNLGVNSYLTLLAGAYNKKPIDLNSSSKGFTSGQNNFNIKILLLSIPQLLVPMLVFGVVKHFFGMSAAVASLGLLGLLGFLLRNKIFNLIVRIYKTEKYTTLAAFKKIE